MLPGNLINPGAGMRARWEGIVRPAGVFADVPSVAVARVTPHPPAVGACCASASSAPQDEAVGREHRPLDREPAMWKQHLRRQSKIRAAERRQPAIPVRGHVNQRLSSGAVRASHEGERGTDIPTVGTGTRRRRRRQNRRLNRWEKLRWNRRPL